MAQQVKKVKFGFKQDDNYRLIPVNGVWGGATARGDVRVDFFYESFAIPNEVTHELTLDNRLGPELGRKPAQDMQRTVLVGMMLTPEQAESIGRWLQEKAIEVRAAKEGREDKGSGPDGATTH